MRRIALGTGAIECGRAIQTDIPLDDEAVSRRHARISWNGMGYVVRDLGSTNGTFVNGEKISGRARLSEGDRILVGTSIIKVVGVDATAANQSEAEARRRHLADHLAGLGHAPKATRKR